MACNCIAEVDKVLREKEMTLEVSFLMPDFRAMLPIQTRWIDGVKRRKKPTTILASFCPFCGMRVNDDEATTGSGG